MLLNSRCFVSLQNNEYLYINLKKLSIHISVISLELFLQFILNKAEKQLSRKFVIDDIVDMKSILKGESFEIQSKSVNT